MRLYLCYENVNDCAWLDEEFEIKDKNQALELAKSYIDRNAKRANYLTHKWVVDGECTHTAEMWPVSYCPDNPEIQNAVDEYFETVS